MTRSTSSRSSPTTSPRSSCRWPARPATRGCSTSHVHDLRDWTHDRHRTVDDTPYGGGAGMVMKPEPWGEALDALRRPAADGDRRRHRRPAASRSPRRWPASWPAASTWSSPAAATRASTSGCSTTPAPAPRCARSRSATTCSTAERWPRWRSPRPWSGCCPASWATPTSLAEESHEDGLLEYPVYTKPATWRGHDVPPVLLSGDHARDRAPGATSRPYAAPPSAAPTSPHPAPAARRRRRSRLVAAAATPASCSPCSGPAGCRSSRPTPASRSRRCTSARRRARPGSPRDTVRGPAGGRLVGAVRGPACDERHVWDIGRLMVAPDLQGRGLGRLLLAHDRGAPRRPRRRRTRCSPAPAACATSGCTRRPATGCAGRGPRPGVVPDRPSDRADLRFPAARRARCGRLAPRPSRPKDRPEERTGGIRVGLLPQGEHDAAGHARRWSATDRTTDSAADLWHSRGET